MRILSVSLENFASYGKLDFTFDDKGLALVQGPTGAGKSTLMDAITWILFGQTSKGGKVDEVLSWPGDQQTAGTIIFELHTVKFAITRTRKPNDLYWRTQDNSEANPSRGKDLIDTQRLINQALGFDYDLYMASAYFHEFSQTANFFSTTAKNRREITEQLVDLSLATDLQLKAKERLKAINKDLTKEQSKLTVEEIKLQMLQTSYKYELAKSTAWESTKDTKVAALKVQYEEFEDRRNMDLDSSRRAIQVHKEFIKEVVDCSNKVHTCETCGQNLPSEGIEAYAAQVQLNQQSEAKIELHRNKIKEIKLRINPYEQQIKSAVDTEINPYSPQTILHNKTEIKSSLDKIQSGINGYNQTIEDLELLQQVLDDYRSITIQNSIKSIETRTNSYLNDYFDGEFRVEFVAEDKDKLEVNIFKDGNECSYTQLSKGQRCLLKLAFGVSVMESAANHNNLWFSQVFFDEALSGLDETMKSKAFRLLQNITPTDGAVYVIDHSEGFKQLFDTVYNVSLVNGKSQLEKT